MSFVFIDPTKEDLEVFKWITDHLAMPGNQLASVSFQIVDDKLSGTSVTPYAPIAENKQIVVTNTFNRKLQEFSYPAVIAYPDEALLEISKWLDIGISKFEYYHPNIPAAPVDTRPFNIPARKDGYYQSNTLDTYPPSYVYTDGDGSKYMKLEVGGWAFVTYYAWKKLDV